MAPDTPETKPLSKMEKMLLLEQQAEAYEATLDTASDGEPALSKKELKDLKKKQEKDALKMEKRAAKKAQNKLALEEDDDEDEESDDDQVNGVNGQADDDDQELDLEYDDDDMEGEGEHRPGQLTLEDKIRRERPPPRIRVMESSQPGYTSLRLENVGIMFRNQAVLKDVTWGVQTGDRIGLVGANGMFLDIRVCGCYVAVADWARRLESVAPAFVDLTFLIA